MRPPRCLRGPQAAQGPRRHRAGGREGGRPGAWRRGDRGTGARRPAMAAGPSQPRPAWLGGGDHSRHGDAAPGAGAPPPQRPLPISPFACRHRPPAARHAGLRPIGPRSRSLPRPRRGQSAEATAALQQGGARQVPIKRGVRWRGAPIAAPPSAMEKPLSLLVRSPTQRHPDLRLRADPAWTVRRLKAELRHLVPGSPVSVRPLPPLFPSALRGRREGR